MVVNNTAANAVKDENELAPWKLTAGLALFALLTALGFSYFGYNLFLLLGGLLSHTDAVTVNKGAFYCLGAAVMGCMLVFFGVRKLMGKTVTARQNKQASLIFFIGLGLIIVLPQLIHYPAVSYLKAQGYSECELQSRQWLHDKVTAFTVSQAHCIELTAAECAEAPDNQKCWLLPKFKTSQVY